MNRAKRVKKLYLNIMQWKTRPVHFYGNVRDEAGKEVQLILRCGSRKQVIAVTRAWMKEEKHPEKLVVRRETEWF
jgi:hypothetical protein